jgi:TetR/AcrR family transcriptional regulator
MVAMLLGFAQKNRGMTRVLIGDALVNENERLQLRINQLFDRLETTLKQALRIAASQGELDSDADASAHANVLLCYVIGRWHEFAKSGFARDPMAQWPQQWAILSHK